MPEFVSDTNGAKITAHNNKNESTRFLIRFIFVDSFLYSFFGYKAGNVSSAFPTPKSCKSNHVLLLFSGYPYSFRPLPGLEQITPEKSHKICGYSDSKITLNTVMAVAPESHRISP
jgi:hypothetical protein